jgi:hypothetical protein
MKFLKSIFFTVLSATTITTAGAAPTGWQHKPFYSSQGATVNVDYQIDDSVSGIRYANPFYVNVSSSALRGAEKVRAILTEDCRSPHLNQKVSFAMDLKWYGDHYAASFDDSKLMVGNSLTDRGTMFPKLKVWSSAGGYGENCTHELAVVVNGSWQSFGNKNSVLFDMNK